MEAYVGNVAKWNGSKWVPTGRGISTDANSHVYSLAVYNDELYAAGVFGTAGGNNISKLSAGIWSAVGNGTNACLFGLTVYNSELYAGGQFSYAGSTLVNGIGKWNGHSWSSLGKGMNATVFFMAEYKTELFAGGLFSAAGGKPVNYVAKFAKATGTAEVDADNISLTVYPNPFSSSLEIDLSCDIYNISILSSEIYFSVFDILGNEVKKLKIENQKTKMLRDNLPDGIYFYKICNHGEVLGAGKIIIE